MSSLTTGNITDQPCECEKCAGIRRHDVGLRSDNWIMTPESRQQQPGVTFPVLCSRSSLAPLLTARSHNGKMSPSQENATHTQPWWHWWHWWGHVSSPSAASRHGSPQSVMRTARARTTRGEFSWENKRSVRIVTSCNALLSHNRLIRLDLQYNHVKLGRVPLKSQKYWMGKRGDSWFKAWQ